MIEFGFPVVCGFCGWRGEVLGMGSHIRREVAVQVGHEMPTLSAAIGHMLCPRCDRTRLQLEAGLLAAPPSGPPAAEGS